MGEIRNLARENKREVKDVFYLIALQGVGYIIPLLVTPYLMYVLGAEKYGHIGFSLSVCQFLNVFIDFGFNLSSTKRVAISRDDPDKLSRIFSSVFYCKLIMLCVSFLVLTGISFIPNYEVYRPAMFAMFGLVVGNAFTYTFLFQGLGQIRKVSIITLIARCLVFPLTFIFVKSPDDVIIAAFLQSATAMVAALISVVYMARKHWVRLLRFSAADCREELGESWPLFLSSAATSVYCSLFILILGYFALPVEVGRYSASDRINKSLQIIILNPTIMAFYPKVGRFSMGEFDKGRVLVRNILWVVLAVTFVVMAVVFVLAPYLPVWLGSDYAGTETILRILCVSSLFVVTGGVTGQLGLLALGGKEQKKTFSRVYFYAAIIALSSVAILSPLLQGIGAAIAILITEAFVCCMMTGKYVGMLKKRKLAAAGA